MKDMADRCTEHASRSARLGLMKGLNPDLMNTALAIEGLSGLWGTTLGEGSQLAMKAIAFAHRCLQEKAIETYMASGTATEAGLAQLRKKAAEYPLEL